MLWNTDNYIKICSLIIAIVGVILTMTQWKNTNKIKRAEYIDQIINKLRFDKEMTKTMYMIQYNFEWYSREFHNNNIELEFSVDKLLAYLSYICYLYKTGNIKKSEFKIFQYQLDRTCISPSIQSYLWNLYHFSKKNNISCSYEYLISYGIKNEFIKPDFYNVENTNYDKYLNF